jgi:hypothetical protein
VVPISTSSSQARRGPTVIELSGGTGGLPKTSFAVCHQVTTLHRAKLTKRQGRDGSRLIRSRGVHELLAEQRCLIARGPNRYTGSMSGEMSDELQSLRNAGYKPVLVGPQPFSLEEILRNVNPAPDKETERFVEAIYADRRQSSGNSSSE